MKNLDQNNCDSTKNKTCIDSLTTIDANTLADKIVGKYLKARSDYFATDFLQGKPFKLQLDCGTKYLRDFWIKPTILEIEGNLAKQKKKKECTTKNCTSDATSGNILIPIVSKFLSKKANDALNSVKMTK